MNLLNQDASKVNSWELMLLQAAKKISLTQPQYELIEKRYENLQQILNNTSDPLLKEAHIFVQGSIGLKTTIKPASNDDGEMSTIDADAIVLLPHAQNASAAQILKAIEDCFKAGSRVEHPIVQLRRGVRIVYADQNPGFHIDITPARCVLGHSDEDGFGFLQVPDRELGWKNSSPRSYSGWLDAVSEMKISIALDSAILTKSFETFAEATQDPMPDYDEYMDSNPLRATIKLLKRHRDEWAIRNNLEKYRPISAIVTTLATKAYEEIAKESHPLRPLEAMLEIVKRMPKFIKKIGAHYLVINPCDEGENFAEKWNRENGAAFVNAFSRWHLSASNDLQLGFEEFSSNAFFENAMREKFGLSKAFITDATKSLPANWKWPGRKDVTSNSISLGIFTGAASNANASQAETKVVGRLG